MNVPPNSAAARDAIPMFFEMLTQESEPSVRVVLGHFIFVYTARRLHGRAGRGKRAAEHRPIC